MNTNQIIHISSEIVILISVTYYLSRQIKGVKTMLMNLDNNVKMLENSYEEKFENLFSIVNNLHNQMNQMNRMNYSIPTGATHPTRQQFSTINQQESLGIRKRKKQEDTNNNTSNENSETTETAETAATQSMKLSNQNNQKRSNPLIDMISNLTSGNPFDLLNIQSAPISIGIGAVNTPQKQSSANIEVIEEEDENRVDEDIEEDLNELLKEN